MICVKEKRHHVVVHNDLYQYFKRCCMQMIFWLGNLFMLSCNDMCSPVTFKTVNKLNLKIYKGFRFIYAAITTATLNAWD